MKFTQRCGVMTCGAVQSDATLNTLSERSSAVVDADEEELLDQEVRQWFQRHV